MNEIPRAYWFPRSLIAFQRWLVFTFVLRKQTSFTLSGCRWTFTNLSTSASLGNCPRKDVEGIGDRKCDLQQWTGLDPSSFTGCPASLFWEEPSQKSEVSQDSCRWAAPGLLNLILTGFTQLLPRIPGYRYLRFLEPSFLLPSNLLKWIFIARKTDHHKLLLHLCSTQPIKPKLRGTIFYVDRDLALIRLGPNWFSTE